jgi:hypothetical protein
VRDIVWLDPAGTQMSEEQWRDGFARSLGVFLSGRGLDERDERGRTIVDNDFLVLVNAHYETVEFKLPAQPEDVRWVLRVDTSNAAFETQARTFAPGDAYAVQGRALALFEHGRGNEECPHFLAPPIGCSSIANSRSLTPRASCRTWRGSVSVTCTRRRSSRRGPAACMAMTSPITRG